MKGKATFKFLGHAFFSVTSPAGRVVMTDPWIEGNKTCPIKIDNVQAAEILTVSHDHADHIGSAVAVARKTGALIVTVPETANRLKSEGLPAANIINSGTGLNIGGSFEAKGITITMLQAFHTSATGVAVSYIVRLDGGACFYHAGDTGLFDSMRLIGEMYRPDVALIPIGNVYTMDAVHAVASLQLLKPKVAIHMHYRTFAALEQSADRFVALAKKEVPRVKVVALEPGHEFILE